MTSSDNTGLGLFDDAASAAGNFPTALRGYDRTAVDDYVRSLEATMVQVRQQAASSESQAGDLKRQLEESRHNNDVDYTNLGGRASEILRLAEVQAREVMERATHDAEHLRAEARREADSTRNLAAREGNELKSGGLAEIDKVRELASFLVTDCCGGRPELCEPLVAEFTPCCTPSEGKNAC